MKPRILIPIALPLVLFCGCADPEPAGGFNPMTANDVYLEVNELAQETRPAPQTKPGPVDDDAPEEFQETESGLRYRIRRSSDGKKPKSDDAVVVYYSGRLDDGTVFDSNYARGTPDEFRLNGVIAGWTEGLQLIGVGGMIELIVPAELGYGESGQGSSIPPNSTLTFLVELVQISQ